MEKNIASIYKITNEINGKCYIGFDISYPKRIKQHYNDSKRGVNSPLCNDIRKYGWENFTKELLAIIITWLQFVLRNYHNHRVKSGLQSISCCEFNTVRARLQRVELSIKIRSFHIYLSYFCLVVFHQYDWLENYEKEDEKT